ncbi:MAG: hypothetical protein M1825_002357 [Sarcosagium campestre]|nr:MAG: hypothetical protein M1825_002357 [Sarcosagium campestre]
MQSISRRVTFAGPAVRRCAERGTRRRNASTEAHDAHGHSEPVNESLGKGFYITLAAVPATFAAVKFFRDAEDGETPVFTRLLERFDRYQQKFEDRNTVHTRMIEQAAFDRNLFHNSEKRTQTFNLRYPETFNTGSPYNVVAGQGGGNIDHMVEYYRNESMENEEMKLKKLEAKLRLQKEREEK